MPQPASWCHAPPLITCDLTRHIGYLLGNTQATWTHRHVIQSCYYPMEDHFFNLIMVWLCIGAHQHQLVTMQVFYKEGNWVCRFCLLSLQSWPPIFHYGELNVNQVHTVTQSSIMFFSPDLSRLSQKKGPTAIVPPSKKLKQTVLTGSMPSINSHSSMPITISDSENDGHQSGPDDQSDSDGSDPEVPLTWEEELSMLFYYLTIYANCICIRGTQAALALTHLHVLQIRCCFLAT